MPDRTAHFDGVGPVRLELIVSTTFPSGVLRLAYRPAPNEEDGPRRASDRGRDHITVEAGHADG